MPADIQEIYATTIQPLSDTDKLLLASLILEKVARKSAFSDNEPAKPKRKGDITKFSGMFNSGNPNSADNEQIDRDLARAYANEFGDET